jgi:hypothetical protein
MTTGIWLREISTQLRQALDGSRRLRSADFDARETCLALRYAQCRDSSHCRNCSTIEQALRTAAWLDHG